MAWLAKWLPRSYTGKSAEALRTEYRLAVWPSNTAFLAGLLGAIALYEWGGYAKNDWRPVALEAGFALAAATVILPTVAAMRGGKAGEAYIAFAPAQRVPPVALYVLLLLGWRAFLYALASL